VRQIDPGRVLVGLEQPTSGRIEVMGKPPAASPARLWPGVSSSSSRTLLLSQPSPHCLERLTEVLAVHNLVTGRAERRQRVNELLAMVALAPASLTATPRALRGQAQRVAIAGPGRRTRLLVLDEPTSALDVSVRAEVMNLLTRLQDNWHCPTSSSATTSPWSATSATPSRDVLGKIVEAAPTKPSWALPAPLHRALAEAVPCPTPKLKPGGARRPRARPAPSGPSPGRLPLPSRCLWLRRFCRAQVPELVELRPGHEAACHIAAARPAPRRLAPDRPALNGPALNGPALNGPAPRRPHPTDRHSTDRRPGDWRPGGGVPVTKGQTDGRRNAEQPDVLARLVDRAAEVRASVAGVVPDDLAACVIVAAARRSCRPAGQYLLQVATGRPVALASPSLHTLYKVPVDYRASWSWGQPVGRHLRDR